MMIEAESRNEDDVISNEKSAFKSKTKITKVVIEGFKSFAKYTEMLMCDKFNIILGPNGSGKSNVLDALCFVLGKSSSKSLRAEKSANLIYNGGKTKNPSKQAEVSIWLDNSDKSFPLSDSEIKISRIVRPNGSSKYKINNKICSRAEIIELLSAVKVNPNGYNIILQGDITRLVEMSSIERRQIIEEIAGINIYEEKKQLALNELAKVQDKLNEAEIILKERENYLKDLKKDRNQALKYKALNDKIKTNKASLCNAKIVNKKKSIEDFNKKISVLDEKLSKLNDTIKKYKEDIKQRKDEINDISKEIEKKGETEQVIIQKQIENLRVDVATKKTKVVDLDKDKNKSLEKIRELEEKIKDIIKKRKEIENKKAEFVSQKDALKQSLNKLSEDIETFRKKHNIDDISEIEKQADIFDKDIDLKQKEIDELRFKQQNFLREKDKLDFQIQTIDDKLKKINEIRQTNKDEIKALEQKKKEFEKAADELNVLLESDSKSASRLGEYRRKINVLQEDLAKLNVKQASIKEKNQGNLAVQKVLENKNIGGVYGTIATLGTVDEKFSTALEVSAAQKMHSIIVDDDKIAAKCINFLKEKKLGVATFLPLNKIQPAKNDKNNFKEKGVFDLAIDLIDFDPKFKNAFSHVFGSTLIIKDLSTARDVGINSIRMVTLDGDLVEKSGAMRGGFRNKKFASFKDKGFEKEIQVKELELNTLQNNMTKLFSEREKNEEQIFRLRDVKANFEGEIIKAEKSLHVDSGEISGSMDYKKELLEKAKTINADISKNEDSISNVMNELTKLKINKQELKNKMTSLRSPIVLAELNAFEEKRKELTTDLIKVEGEINNFDLQIKDVINKDKENTELNISEFKKDTKTFDFDKNTLSKEIVVLEKDLKIKEAEQAKFMTQFKSLFEKRNKLSDEISAIEDKMLKNEENSRKEELSINIFDAEKNRFNSELSVLEVEFEQFEGIELIDKTEDVLKKELVNFERSLVLIGNVNMRSLEVYESVEKEYVSLVNKKKKLSEERFSVLELMDEIEHNKKDLFNETLHVIDKNFRNIFNKLTTKGEAFLDLMNPDSPFEDGLKIKVKLTGEKFLDLRSLSGGEKTLTALAFLFSIQEHEPAPFYIMDEVDAALDKQNSEKLAKLIRDYCNNAQYIVISHNDSVISEGDVLYGVSMKPETGISSAVSIKMD